MTTAGDTGEPRAVGKMWYGNECVDTFTRKTMEDAVAHARRQALEDVLEWLDNQFHDKNWPAQTRLGFLEAKKEVAKRALASPSKRSTDKESARER